MLHFITGLPYSCLTPWVVDWSHRETVHNLSFATVADYKVTTLSFMVRQNVYIVAVIINMQKIKTTWFRLLLSPICSSCKSLSKRCSYRSQLK